MSFAVREAWESDLDRLVELAVECQGDPNRSCPSLSDEAGAIAAELQQIEGADDWTKVTWVALDDERNVIGWIAAEFDESMGRVWWFGPFVADAAAPLADAILDGLISVGRRSLEGFAEHQLAVDARSTLLPRCAERNGFSAGEGSLALRLGNLDVGVVSSVATIDAAVPADTGAMALHDAIFPGTHSTGEYLFGLASDRYHRYVARLDGEIVGYVATELAHDGSLYVDYLGVAAACRGRGIGRALVATAILARSGDATHAHLTVRVSNGAARRLYASLGFVEDVVLVPYRIGFSLD
jgi:GNAT superfamily N-acetyltransferase